MMKHFVFFMLGTLFLFFSCGDSVPKDTSATPLKQFDLDSSDFPIFFIPLDSIHPFVTIFKDEKAPLEERFFRSIVMKKEDSLEYVLEKYNADMRFTEGFTFDLKKENVLIDHMMVDAYGKKRKSRIHDNLYFPYDMGEAVMFHVDFPAHVDSIVISYQSKRELIDYIPDFVVLEEEYETLVLRDSSVVTFINYYTEEEGKQLVVTNNYYAKGIGLVRFEDVSGEIQFNVVRFLSDKWWNELISN